MSLIKKIVACSLAISVTLSGVYANAAKPTEMAKKQLSTTEKIIAGVSTVGGVGLLAGIGIGAWQYNKLNILVIGSNEGKRNELIELLNQSSSSKPSMLDDHLNETTRYSPNYKEKYGCAAKFKNYKISSCDLDDPTSPALIKNAQLIIVIPDKDNSIDDITNLLKQHRNKNSLVWEIWDEDYQPNVSKGDTQTLKDFIVKSIAANPNITPCYYNRTLLIQELYKELKADGCQLPISGDHYSYYFLSPSTPCAFYWSRIQNSLTEFIDRDYLETLKGRRNDVIAHQLYKDIFYL